MEVINFIKEYWVQVTFICTSVLTLIKFSKSMIEATKCSLRNDILSVYDRCKDSKKITKWQLHSIEYSADIYFKLKGNSFIKDLVEKVKSFDIVD